MASTLPSPLVPPISATCPSPVSGIPSGATATPAAPAPPPCLSPGHPPPSGQLPTTPGHPLWLGGAAQAAEEQLQADAELAVATQPPSPVVQTLGGGLREFVMGEADRKLPVTLSTFPRGQDLYLGAGLQRKELEF